MASLTHLMHFALPGSPLVAAGRLLAGALLVSAALVCLCALSLVALGIPGFERPLAMGCLVGYGALGVVSWVAWALGHRQPRLDAQAIRLAHRQAAGAFLRREHAEALAAAWRLCRLAGQEAGAWLLLREIATAAGDQPALRRARRELSRLASDHPEP